MTDTSSNGPGTCSAVCRSARRRRPLGGASQSICRRHELANPGVTPSDPTFIRRRPNRLQPRWRH